MRINQIVLAVVALSVTSVATAISSSEVDAQGCSQGETRRGGNPQHFPCEPCTHDGHEICARQVGAGGDARYVWSCLPVGYHLCVNLDD